MHLLDCGCGPGSITIDLAAAVDPGEVIGIDADETPLVLARALAQEMDRSNVRFLKESIYSLPFPDNTFDVVYSCQVFPHLNDPTAALREIYRVLKPGGIAAITSGANRNGFIWPDEPLLKRMFEIYMEQVARNGGQPYVGYEQHALAAAVGFQEIELTGRVHFVHGSDDAATGWIGALEELSKTSLELEENAPAVEAAWRRWGSTPNAYYASPLLELIARKPEN
jgi:SAM-dependent methyltransferase